MPAQESETDAIAISPALTGPVATGPVVMGPSVLFDGFRLQVQGDLLRADGTTVLLGSRALDVLRVLVGRAGQLVPKRDIMDAVWPGVAVEEANLTVQVSTLRKVIDAGRLGPSCIQTVPGRGYRFVLPLTPVEAAAASPPEVGAPRSRASGRFGRLILAAILAASVAVAWYIAEQWHGAPANLSPRLSLVVLPFQNTGGDPADNYLADAITDDLTSDLSHIPGAKVIARASAQIYQGKPVDPRLVGRELDVRYVLSGSVRRVGGGLRVNAELVSAETGEQIWSDRFEEDIRDLNAGQNEIIVRIRGPLRIRMVDYESMRSARERPTNPDAFDLVLRARFIWENQRYSRERGIAAASLFERALQLDPSSVPAMTGAAQVLLEQVNDGHDDADTLARAETLIAHAAALDPNRETVLEANVFLLRTKERWADLAYAAQKLIDAHPNNFFGYHQLGNAKLYAGQPGEAVASFEAAVRLAPRDPAVALRYQKLASAMVLLGRGPEAIMWAQRYLVAEPDGESNERSFAYLAIAAGEIWSGHKAEAERAVAEANRIWPFNTVRGQRPRDRSNPVAVAQVSHFQEALRAAGLRDHAEEEADFAAAPQAELRTILAGPTPTTLFGASTIRTPELAIMLAGQKPLILDTMTNVWGPSLPGAIGLRRSGLGGSFSDQAQERLRRKVQQLTDGDLARPIVVVGWNVERFEGHNLALRLLALGYRQIYWYRGGREAWEAAGMPETQLEIQNW